MGNQSPNPEVVEIAASLLEGAERANFLERIRTGNLQGTRALLSFAETVKPAHEVADSLSQNVEKVLVRLRDAPHNAND